MCLAYANASGIWITATGCWPAFRSTWSVDSSRCWTRLRDWRTVYHLRRSDHITDVLVCHHWQRVPERVQYKITVLVYKVLYGLAPTNLSPLNYVAELPGNRPLRSASSNRLAVPPVKLTTVANQTFPVVGPRTSNDLPNDLTSAESLFTVCQQLKTYLFVKFFFLTSLFSGLNLCLFSKPSRLIQKLRMGLIDQRALHWFQLITIIQVTVQ